MCCGNNGACGNNFIWVILLIIILLFACGGCGNCGTCGSGDDCGC